MKFESAVLAACLAFSTPALAQQSGAFDLFTVAPGDPAAPLQPHVKHCEMWSHMQVECRLERVSFLNVPIQKTEVFGLNSATIYQGRLSKLAVAVAPKHAAALVEQLERRFGAPTTTERHTNEETGRLVTQVTWRRPHDNVLTVDDGGNWDGTGSILYTNEPLQRAAAAEKSKAVDEAMEEMWE